MGSKLLYLIIAILLVGGLSCTRRRGSAMMDKQEETLMPIYPENEVIIIGSPDTTSISQSLVATAIGDSATPVIIDVKNPHQLLTRIGYITSYNNDTKCPNWVAWHLTAEHSDGPFPRSGEPYFENGEACGIGKVDKEIWKGNYFVDLEAELPRQEHADWAEMPVGMSHGHICPAGDNRWDKAAMNQSFLLTNMCPQTQKLNEGGWRKLEDKCRDWAVEYGDIYIVSGPIFNDGVRRCFGRNKIGIPDAFFKVVLCMNGTPRAIGFIYPNDESSQSMRNNVRSVDEVERITKMDFFSALPDDIEDVVESQNNLNDWK